MKTPEAPNGSIYKQPVREFYQHNFLLLERNRAERIEITPEFFRAAMEELRISFILGQEGGMLAFFRPTGDILSYYEFYGSQWLEREEYGHSTSASVWKPNGASQHEFSVAFRFERLTRLLKQRPKNELLITCHTHPVLALPSERDLRPESVRIIIGFDKIPRQLRQLILKSFADSPKFETLTEIPKYHGQMPAKKWGDYVEAFRKGNIKRRALNNIPPEVYERAITEASPTVRLFRIDKQGSIERLPLYVGGHKLL